MTENSAEISDSRNSHGELHACRIVTTEASARILLAAQLAALEEFHWTVVSGDVPRLRDGGVRTVHIPMRREPSASDVLAFFRLLRFFRRNRFSFVQTHTPKASLLGLPAARLAGQRTVYTMHGALVFRGNSTLANVVGWMFERWCCAWAHVVLMQSAEDAERLPRLRACPVSKARYIGNGVDVERFSHHRPPAVTSEPARPQVIMISRLVAEKGCLDYFTVAERLHGRADFVHVGPTESDQGDAIPPAKIADLRERGVVRFIGEVDDVRPCLDCSDVFVLPSYREGIPRAAMEAAFRELPVVAYDIRGVREVVPPGLGLLVRRADVEGLVQATARLLSDADRRRSSGVACRQHVAANFSELEVVRRIRAAYAGILSPHASPHASADESPSIPCFSVDVEDFYEGASFLGLELERTRGIGAGLEAVEQILDRLSVASGGPCADASRLTFFVVGGHASAFQAPLRRLVAVGHELASHGPDHGRVPGDARDLVRWLIKGREQLEQTFGVEVRGFRAPRFERPPCLSLADYRACIVDAGFSYVSDLESSGRARLLELAVWRIGLLPIGGGSYQRVLPPWVPSRLLRRAPKVDSPRVLYYHSYDFGMEVGGGRFPRSALEARLMLGRRAAGRRFETLLAEFGSQTCAQALGLAPPRASL